MDRFRNLIPADPDQRLATAFFVSVYALSGLAGGMLAFGEEAPFPAALTIPLAALAYWFNEQYRVVRISALTANLLGIAALSYAIFEFFGESIEARLLAGAHFLVYLSWIVLFQDKGVRQYWWLCALALLQVAVGSVLTLAPVYGLMMLLFMFLSLWTLSVFTLYQSAQQFGLIDGKGRAVGASPGVEGGASAEPAVASGTPKSATLGAPWEVLRSREPTQVSNSVIRPPSGHWLEGRSLLRISVISAAGLALAMVLFVCIPRVWVGSANPFSTRSEIGARPLTGFSAEVRLGQMGQILESTERVLQVRLIDNYTKNPISLDDFCRKHGTLEPMFRGSVLDLYSRGRWAAAGMGERNANLRPMQPQREGMIRQEYILDPIGTDVLFGMRPVTLGALRDPTQPVAVDLDSGTLTSMRGDTRERLTYRLYSAPAVPGQYRLDVVPPLYGMSRFAQRRCLEIPRERLPRLVALAEELVRPDRLPELPDESTERIKAAVLEGYFLEPQRFAYTLNMEVRDPTIDPVEDFLFNRRSGHCEYFASSLTLMLRAVDIPARLITGFKGAEYNSHTEYYEVQQRHAHAWVEAFIDGEWIVLDPTPGGRDESVRNIAASSGFWKNAKSSLNSLWSNYVVSLSYNRQKQEIYDPLQTTVTGGINTVRGRLDGVKELLQRIRLLIMSPDQWFSWQGLVFTFLLMTTTVLAVRTFRWFARLIRNRLQARRLGRQASRRRVAFYEQFLALMDSIGLRPGVAQTAQEFAETIRRELSSKAGLNGMAEFPERVARNFYRVRFAEQELAPGELDELKRQFDQFAAMLKSGKELRTA